MAELASIDYEVKDEELVDFEGSDYGSGSDEELDLEDDTDAALRNDLSEEALTRNGSDPGKVVASKVEDETVPQGNEARFSTSVVSSKREEAKSGEIEIEKDAKDKKDDGVVAQAMPSLSSAGRKERFGDERRLVDSRRRHRKADLEDGELDDAAMPEDSDHEAEGIADEYHEDQKDRRGRKRRKDRFFAERHSEDLDRKRRDSLSVMAGSARLHRNRGRQPDRSEGLSKVHNAGGRGMMQLGRFGNNPNMAPGIIGPGGPLMHIDMGPAIALRPVSRGFIGPIGGMPLPSEVSMTQLQEAMAVHEQMFWSHRTMQQFARAAGDAARNIPGPLPGAAMRPMGFDFSGPLPRGGLHLPAQGPSVTSPINLGEPMEPSLPRVSRTGYGAGRGLPSGGGMLVQGAGRPGSSPRNSGMVRQNSWPSAPLQSTDVHAGGRGRGHGRGHPTSVVWADPQNVRQPFVLPQAGLSQSGGAQNANMKHAVNSNMIDHGAAKMAHGHNGPMGQGDGRLGAAVARPDSEGLWRVNDERIMFSGVPDLGNNTITSTAPRGKRDREASRQKHSSVNNNSSRSANVVSHGNGPNNSSSLIHLGAPVQKSRLLTVSGLPENTSMSVVVEAFESQGKVMKCNGLKTESAVVMWWMESSDCGQCSM